MVLPHRRYQTVVSGPVGHPTSASVTRTTTDGETRWNTGSHPCPRPGPDVTSYNGTVDTGHEPCLIPANRVGPEKESTETTS